MSDAITSEGTVIKIGTGDAATVVPGSDTFLTIGEVVSFDGPGGETPMYDVSHLGSTRAEKRPGLPDEGSLSLEVNYVPGNTGQLEFQEARGARQLRNIQIIYTDAGAGRDDFTAYCTGFRKNGSVGNKVSATLTFEVTGAVTFTA